MKYDASTGLMDFAAALTSMQKGGNVRRGGWKNAAAYLCLYNHRLIQCDWVNQSVETVLQVKVNDILAEDWIEAVVPL
jgi:hypothetical protein